MTNEYLDFELPIAELEAKLGVTYVDDADEE